MIVMAVLLDSTEWYFLWMVLIVRVEGDDSTKDSEDNDTVNFLNSI